MDQGKRVDFKGKNNPFYGKSHSEESKQKMRESLIGKTAWNKGTHLSSRGMLNKTHSEETKAKLSEIAKLRTGKNAGNWQGGLSFEHYERILITNLNKQSENEIIRFV